MAIPQTNFGSSDINRNGPPHGSRRPALNDSGVDQSAEQPMDQQTAPKPQATLAAASAVAHDPRQFLADEVDKHLHLGAKLGTALWLVWGAIAFVSIPALVIGVGIIPAVIFNMLLVSPKAVYKFSEILLDFVGVGEAMQAADEAGIGKIKITLKDWQKGIILFYDILVILVLAMIIFTTLISICYVTQGVVVQAGLKVTSFVTGNNTYASIAAFCKTLTK